MLVASGLMCLVVGLIILHGFIAGEVLLRFRFLYAPPYMVERHRSPVGYLLTMLLWTGILVFAGSIFLHEALPSAPSFWP